MKTHEAHTILLARIDELMHVEEGDPDGPELDMLVSMVELYEKFHWPIGVTFGTSGPPV